MTLTRDSTLREVARQALTLAVELAIRQPLEMKRIEAWSAAEGMADAFEEFRRLVARHRRE